MLSSELPASATNSARGELIAKLAGLSQRLRTAIDYLVEEQSSYLIEEAVVSLQEGLAGTQPLHLAGLAGTQALCTTGGDTAFVAGLAGTQPLWDTGTGGDTAFASDWRGHSLCGTP